jgi:hypothetical protein
VATTAAVPPAASPAPAAVLTTAAVTPSYSSSCSPSASSPPLFWADSAAVDLDVGSIHALICPSKAARTAIKQRSKSGKKSRSRHGNSCNSHRGGRQLSSDDILSVLGSNASKIISIGPKVSKAPYINERVQVMSIKRL